VFVEPACQSCVKIKKSQSACISHFLFIHPAVSEWNGVNVYASYFIAFRNKLYALFPFSTRSRAVLYWRVCWFCTGKLPTSQLCFDIVRSMKRNATDCSKSEVPLCGSQFGNLTYSCLVPKTKRPVT
jgi:hypothetical protein